jgi:glycosyltransferase involved in cell wall biosynthesis
MPDPVSVSVIMPTEARPERAESLRRALQSVLSQEGVHPVPIVVVNGQSAHPPLVDELARSRDVHLIRLPAADLPGALRAGRDQVATPYFAELDDDDELLPGALAMRVEALQARADVDAVVTRGFVDHHGRREPNVADLEGAQADPLRALLDHNWLTPCAGLFRTATVGPQYFADIPAYLEWTYIGLRLSLERRILFSNRLTWVYRADTVRSLSKSRAYVLLQPAAVERLLSLPVPPDVRARLEQRLHGALHAAAALELDAGNLRAAWRWHLRSLARAGGWRYALYTRRLAAALLRSPGARGWLCGLPIPW